MVVITCYEPTCNLGSTTLWDFPFLTCPYCAKAPHTLHFFTSQSSAREDLRVGTHLTLKLRESNTHRIHGAGIYANIGGILMVNVTIYGIHGSYGTNMVKPTNYYKMACSTPNIRPTLPIKWCHIGTPTPPILWRKWQGGYLSLNCLFKAFFQSSMRMIFPWPVARGFLGLV